MAPAAVAWHAGPLPNRPPDGITVPDSSETLELIEKSAEFNSRRPEEYESKMRELAQKTPNLQFVLEHHPHNPYYLWRLAEIREGRGFNDSGKTPIVKKRKGPPEPAPFDFSARMPTISALDLDVVRLTALFVAVKGTAWMTRFSQTYGQHPQFAFLRPQHSFHQYFEKMKTEYQELLPSEGGDLAKRQARRMEELEKNISDKYHILDRAKQRADWVKTQEAKKVQKQEAEEQDRRAYAEIDWHDFAIVATINFTEADERANLPEPQSLNDLQSQSLEQKAALAPTGMRIEEAMPEDFAFFGAVPGQTQPQPQYYNAQPPSHLPQPPQFSPMPYAPTPPQASPSPAPYIPAQASSAEESSRVAERQAEAERAAAARAAAAGTGPMRIKENYVPRAQARRAAANTVLCPICKQQIPADEYSEHVRIEQLDPRWREQSRIAQQRSLTTNLSTADVANNLKRLASQRSDVFDPITGREIAPDARDTKRQEVSQGAAPGAVGAPEERPTDVQDQIKRLQNKYGGQ